MRDLKETAPHSNWKTNLQCAGLLFAALFLVYPDLFFARVGSLTGDHQFQHYPWGFLLAESLKKFQFPFWTDQVQCGFPLAAEGQAGVFYPINWILYLTLPFQWAYSYTNIVHFFISGWGTFCYAKKMRLDSGAAMMTAFIFLFGAGFGGAYYNITSLKTLAWFPWMLFWLESYVTNGKKIANLMLLAIAVAMSLLAGYLQVAILALFIFSVYVLLRILFFSEQAAQSISKKAAVLLAVGASVAGGILIASPQLFLTFELARLSNRVGLAEDYAYVGSLSPLALLTYIVPGLRSIFRGNNLYLGILPLFFVCVGITARDIRKSMTFKLWIAIGILSFLLALGEWSPLYVALIKLTKFYSFRTPSKFLIFMCFAVSLLGGLGFQAFLKTRARPSEKTAMDSAVKCFLRFVGILSAAYVFIYVSLRSWRGFVTRLGRWFIDRFIYNRAGHPHSLENYHERLDSALNYYRDIMSFGRFWIFWAAAMIVIGIALVLRFNRNKRLERSWLAVGMLFLAVDWYGHSIFAIKRDFAPYEMLERKDAASLKLFEEVKAGRVQRVMGFSGPGETLSISPSLNIVYGYADMGLYSPFVLRRYYESIGLLGGVDDSNRLVTPAPEFVLARLALLSFLDVSHILTSRPLHDGRLKLLSQDEAARRYLYLNRLPHSRTHFITRYELVGGWPELWRRLLEPKFDPRQVLFLESSELVKMVPESKPLLALDLASVSAVELKPDYQKWLVRVGRPGFFVVSDLAYPGWQARVNGENKPMICADGLFRSVRLSSAGIYEIEFKFSPNVSIRRRW